MLVVVLPSCGIALVTRTTLGGAPREDSSSEVRSARYDSAICDCGRDCVTNSTASLEAATERRRVASSEDFLDPKGIMPSAGNDEIIWACSGVRTVLSKFSSKNARP